MSLIAGGYWGKRKKKGSGTLCFLTKSLFPAGEGEKKEKGKRKGGEELTLFRGSEGGGAQESQF